ncbi:MAG: 1-deoxy-D-xylulose-5-phosphate reductoisomerase [Verrucomicrobiae bacterium]|nr:1-deoxy-D-xylulose-5-phosphate reductoisomerase [Verrucomicrobiae bacterium]
MKRIVLLGSTGSIGQSTLKVVADLPDRLQLVGLAAGGGNLDELARQTREYRPAAACVFDRSKLPALREKVGNATRLLAGEEGLVELAMLPEADIVLIAIVGTAGLRPALAAIEAGKDLAVASKEILVMAGEAVTSAAKRQGVRILPVDSEHNAIWQCLDGKPRHEVRNLWLTASGGPFRKKPQAEFAKITLQEALQHPTWSMGNKITLDSATLMNKGLEMIEARWLFDIEMARVRVVVHPQSIVHSFVEFVDGSLLAQLCEPNMRLPIQYALTYPERLANTLPAADFMKMSRLEFEMPDHDRFPALGLARAAGERGGTAPAVFNAANEVAVARFVKGEIRFPDIWGIVEHVLAKHRVVEHADLGQILEADRWARAASAAWKG